MRCDDFLEGYSDFVDGRLGPPDHRPFEAHLERCGSCARYDRVVQRGLFIYRNLPELQPSPDFLPRLRHRLYHVRDGDRLAQGTPMGSAALVAVAAVGFLALAWLPFASRLSVEVALPPVAVEAPPGEMDVPSLFSRGPFLAPAASPSLRPAGVTVPPAGWTVGSGPDPWTGGHAFPALFEPTSPSPALPTGAAAVPGR